MGSNDKNLIDAHCQGDPDAFGEIVRRHGAGVFGYLMRMSNNHQQAEDLFQETFKRVHEKAHTLRSNYFKAWLFKIATRVAIDSLRKQKRLSAISLDQTFDCTGDDCEGVGAAVAAPNQPAPSDNLAKAEQADQVRRAISLLPEKQRATLVLTYYQQISYRQAAKALGCSIGTVKTQMYRALKTLARELPEFGRDSK